MAERGWGRIINIGSQQSLSAFGDSGVYGVSKMVAILSSATDRIHAPSPSRSSAYGDRLGGEPPRTAR